jgi:hypothetical protein
MSIYGINNNSSLSSTSSMKQNAFFHKQTILNKYRIDQEMKNDGSDQYYVIMFQIIQTEFVGDILSPKSKISEEVIVMVKILNDNVKDFNKSHLRNVG